MGRRSSHGFRFSFVFVCALRPPARFGRLAVQREPGLRVAHRFSARARASPSCFAQTLKNNFVNACAPAWGAIVCATGPNTMRRQSDPRANSETDNLLRSPCPGMAARQAQLLLTFGSVLCCLALYWQGLSWIAGGGEAARVGAWVHRLWRPPGGFGAPFIERA